MSPARSGRVAAGLALAAIVLGPASRALAQELPLSEPFSVIGITSYDEAIPRPDEVLGFEVGTRHTRPEELARYFEAVDASSDRVRLERHGFTHEGRPLIHAIVSAPENLARLEEIRAANLRLFASAESVSDRELETMPAVVYLAYSVHGNEASGSEASLLALFHLAAGRGPAVEDALSDLVVIIDPSLNPDGRDRFVDWVNRNRGRVPSTDPQDLEHNEPWPGGRTNHYWFDLNRDWLPVTQPESRARLALFARWRPQLLFDFHEMGREATFFFQPGVPSRTNPNTPESNQELTARIGRYHARAFDRVGQPYFSGETFDDFFYGKGSTYPDINGAVGVLFEQASSRALAVETSTGELRYARTIRNQFIATLSSLEAAVDLRTELLRHQRDFYGSVDEWAAGLPHDAWLVERAGTGGRAEDLVGLLATHGIRSYENSEAVEADGRRLSPGEAYIAPVRQAQGRLLEALMERVTSFRDSVFYDVSAWTLPLAYDVPAGPISGSAARALGVEFAPDSPRLNGPPGPSSIGWLVPWGSEVAARSLVRWLDAGLEARVLTRPFSIESGAEEREFPAGTLVLAPRRERELVPHGDLQPVLEEIGAEAGTLLIPLGTTSTPAGPDLGGPAARLILPREVAILTGGRLSSNRAGEIWHLLDLETSMPVSLLDADRLPRLDLARYDVIIVAGGSAGSAAGEVLKEWVDDGGTLVALGTSAAWSVEAGLLEREERVFDVDSLVTGAGWSDLGVARGTHSIAGTILESRLDQSHPLAFGIGDRLPLFVTSGRFFSPPDRGAVATYSESPRLSGWLSDARISQVSGASAVSVERIGGGRVIAVHAYPAYRGYWKGGARLVWNAVFFGPTL
ncbi:MAG: M14 family metallopeptidase [marine benthic group bacterium]|nr:M14 family metallopeptidase [Candidatus Carthagonibacter metallireducens]